jgi:2-methylcitrate dehydratase PrpD
MKTFSEIIAEYIVNLSDDSIPRDVSIRCKQVLLDTFGVIIFGANMPWSRMVLEYFIEQGGVPEAQTLFPRAGLPAAAAAFVNGTMAHSFDYDDDLAACHIACAVIPAALALAQKGRISGRRLITAIAAGYDIAVRLAETLDGHHLYAMGYHPTSVCGVFGAAAAACCVLKLSSELTTNALGIAGSFPSGSLEWLGDGSMTKRFHGGKAASEGVLAALLARKGFTGPRRIFEGENGVFKMFNAQKSHDTLVSELSRRFDVLKSYIKLYPCCTCNAPVIDAVIEIRQKYRLALEDIAEIEVGLRKTCINLVGEPIELKQNPRTALDAQMSAPFCVAAALVDGQLFPPQFAPEKIENSEILKLARKVRTVWKEELDVSGSPRPVPATVSIRLRDGNFLEKRVDYQKGTYRNPLQPQELERKFLICTDGKLSEQFQKIILERIAHLDRIEDVNRLLETE